MEADFYPDCYKYKKSLMLLLLKKQFGLNYDETYLRHQNCLRPLRLVLLMLGQVYVRPEMMVLEYVTAAVVSYLLVHLLCFHLSAHILLLIGFHYLIFLK